VRSRRGAELASGLRPSDRGSGAVGDRPDDLWDQKREPHEAADMTHGEAFGGSDFVERMWS
jgi:hypothetical protein